MSSMLTVDSASFAFAFSFDLRLGDGGYTDAGRSDPRVIVHGTIEHVSNRQLLRTCSKLRISN